MAFNYLTLLTALALSASAIFYSVSGLAIIFAGAVVPVIIMGTILEISKLVAAVWLHRNWDKAVWWLKTYLSAAVIILMVITSMGIFGYLSKSHIQQTADSQDQQAKIQSITERLALSENKMNRWRRELDGLVNGTNVRVDTVLAREQKELDSIYARLNAEKESIQKSGDGDVALQTQRLKQAADRKESAIKALGPKPNRREVQRLQSQELSVASRAQKEIVKIQANTKELLATVEPKYTAQLEEVRARISNLKNQSGDSTDTIETKISNIESKLLAEQKVIDTLSDEKVVYESRTRKLEAEVGPIRYIAAFIYEDTTQNLLEEAVRWVIVIIIVVFDPLAVLLLIATQYSFERREEELKLKKLVHDEVVEEVDHIIHDLPEIKDEDIPPMPNVKKPKEIDFGDLLDAPDVPDMTIEAPEFTMTTESFDPYNQGSWSDYVVEDSVKHFEEQVQELQDVVEPEPVMPENINVPEEEITPMVEEIFELDDSDEAHVDEELEIVESNTDHVMLTKVSDDYINYNGKIFRIQALFEAHPELHLNFKAEVLHGEGFPGIVDDGAMLIRTDMLPTKLYRFNGHSWDSIDKNVLEYSAYSDEYIQTLIGLISNNKYNPELLNESEKQHIEELLSQE